METRNYLKSFFTEHWKYQAVSTACKLNLFDILSDAKDHFEIAIELKLSNKHLKFLLTFLVQAGFLELEHGKYLLNEKSRLLTESDPDSLKYACMNWSDEHLISWNSLSYSISTGSSSFEFLFNKTFFEYMNEQPDKLHNYQKAMFEYACDDYRGLPDLIDFSKHGSIMDVGGGYGAALIHIARKYPELKCVLFELSEVLQGVENELFEKVAGNFFESIPKISEAIILSRVLHDWQDEKATRIIENCFNALPVGGTIYLIENLVDVTTSDLSQLSLNMLVMCESFERSSIEYISLCGDAGFMYQSSIQLNELQTVLIFKK